MKRTKIYSAGIHAGEETQVAGNRRSGMVLFSGCHLACSFCYTPEVVEGNHGIAVDSQELEETCRTLLRGGAENLNFISATHVWGTLRTTLANLRSTAAMNVPVILKISGFESVTFAREMAEFSDILIPDFKVASSESAESVNLPPHYGATALHFIAQASALKPLNLDPKGIITSGVVVRHLLMPGHESDSFRVVDALGSIRFSGAVNLMTCFVDNQRKKIFRADPSRVVLLIDAAQAYGITVLVDGKLKAPASQPKLEVVA